MSRPRALPAPPAPVVLIDDAAYRRIKQVVWEALYRWEQAGAPGSARPVFERAWANGLRLEGLAQPAPVALVREQLYQRWLREGPRLTPASREEILRTRPRARRIIDQFGIGVPTREPGSDG